MPDPNKVVTRDKVEFPDRPQPTTEQMDAFIDSVVCKECICSGYGLAELIKIAQDKDLTYEQVMQLTGAGTDCEVCVPYIKRAVETGQSEIDIKPTDTGMYIKKDGILEKEPPKLAKSNMDPAKMARLEALGKDDEKDAATIKTDME